MVHAPLPRIMRVFVTRDSQALLVSAVAALLEGHGGMRRRQTTQHMQTRNVVAKGRVITPQACVNVTQGLRAQHVIALLALQTAAYGPVMGMDGVSPYAKWRRQAH
jgi:hypothetical protein